MRYFYAFALLLSVASYAYAACVPFAGNLCYDTVSKNVVDRNGQAADWVKAPVTQPIGFNTNVFWYPQSEQISQLNEAKNMGVNIIRHDMLWSLVQATSSQSYDWSRYDFLFTEAKKRGIQTLFIIDYSAPWARHASCPATGECKPADNALFAKFAGEVAKRYGPQGGHYYEVWNEPNLSQFWATGPNAAEYTELLKAAYVAIHAADPQAVVVSGGLARHPNALTFLKGMYDAGAKNYMDVVGFHPYTYPVEPNDYNPTLNAWNNLYETTPSVRSIMTANGDGVKKVWITEVGAPTNGPSAGATCDDYDVAKSNHVDECLQEKIYTQIIQNTRNLDWVYGTILFMIKDNGTSTSTSENFYGVIRKNGTHKPSYIGVRTLLLGR